MANEIYDQIEETLEKFNCEKPEDLTAILNDIGEGIGCVNEMSLVIKTFKEICEGAPYNLEGLCVSTQKEGSWVGRKYGRVHCTSCGELAYKDADEGYVITPYCPWCGAKMTDKTTADF